MQTRKIAISLFLGLFLFGGAAHAAEPLPTAVAAIVDVQRILSEALVSKDVRKQLEVRRSTFQKEIEKEENSLRSAEQALSKQRGKIPAQDYAEREQQLRQRFLTVENHVQARRKVLDRSYAEAMAAVRKALLDVVAAIARERGVNVVITAQQALWADKPLDITNDVLARLDNSVSRIDVNALLKENSKEGTRD
ncbi:MAG: OmpH family outer membrane protein [Alphaproteobacteria bacterium]|nr:OmpH family outer membrane protein [Alphaproteobacteria bacterium]